MMKLYSSTEPNAQERHSPRVVRGLVCAFVVIAVAFLVDSLLIVPSNSSDVPATGPSSVPVHVTRPSVENFPVYLIGLGTVEALSTVAIKTRVDGELQQVLFTEGQSVKKGDLLAIIDPRPYQAALDQAQAKIQQDEANLANAQFLLAKDEKLNRQGVTTDEALETQQSQVKQLEAQLAQDQAAKESADVSLSYTQIRSPIDGRTGIRQIDAGNQVHTTDSSSIVVITQTRPISVVSTLREQDLELVRAGLQRGPLAVIALAPDLTTHLASGTVSVIDNEIDQNSGSVRIKSTFANTDDALWPGQFVTVKILENTLQDAITVPSAALQRGSNGYFIYVVGKDDRAMARQVTAGPIDGGRAVITAGLSALDDVVTEGQYRLDNGTQIHRLDDPTAGSSTARRE